MSKNNITHVATRKSSGSVVPVGSKTGKILINSIDASKIMDAVRKVANGGKTERVKISDTTVEKLTVSFR
ncbi:MAG: hypothetical protein ACO1N9_05510 [Flavobacterium sp.]